MYLYNICTHSTLSVLYRVGLWIKKSFSPAAVSLYSTRLMDKHTKNNWLEGGSLSSPRSHRRKPTNAHISTCEPCLYLCNAVSHLEGVIMFSNCSGWPRFQRTQRTPWCKYFLPVMCQLFHRQSAKQIQEWFQQMYKLFCHYGLHKSVQ